MQNVIAASKQTKQKDDKTHDWQRIHVGMSKGSTFYHGRHPKRSHVRTRDGLCPQCSASTGYGILAVHVDTLPLFRDRGKRSKLFAAAMRESATLFDQKARNTEVVVEHLGELGKISSVVGRLCHSKKRIEFVVIDKDIRLEEVARQSPVPVFPVLTTKTGLFNKAIFHNPPKKGVFAMSTTSKKRHFKSCVLFGALTTGLYASVFANQDAVMTYFTKGGLFALLPVATVFAVSYFHGNFTSSFWSALGIEASKKSTAPRVAPEQKVTDAVVAPRPDTRPRAQVNA